MIKFIVGLIIFGLIALAIIILIVINFSYKSFRQLRRAAEDQWELNQKRKEQKEKSEMLGRLAIGDSVLTTSGFYGVVIDMNEDTVVVEFGNNKNCRIPMQKQAIVQVEKPQDAIAEDESN